MNNLPTNKTRHELKCLRNHLKRQGNYLLNEKEDASEFHKGRGDGFLRVLDMLNGEITGDSSWFEECICKSQRIPLSKENQDRPPYNHYAKQVLPPQRVRE